MKILLTGAGGMVGQAVQSVMADSDLHAFSRDDLDVTDKAAVAKLVSELRPNFVINAAAYTHVDKAEDDKEACFKINTEAVENLVGACNDSLAHFIHISTAYVFDGNKDSAYLESDARAPINVYGESKAKAEEFIEANSKKYTIIRTDALFGPSGPNRGNFLETMIALAKDHEELKIISDKKSSPTYTFDLAEALSGMMTARSEGIFHIVNEPGMSRFDMIQMAFKIIGLERNLIPVGSDVFPRKAKCPINSTLENTRFKKLPMIEDALTRYLGSI